MALISKILFPVDFSPSSKAMAAYVHRAAAFFHSQVSLIHVVDPNSYSGLDLYDRSPYEVEEERMTAGRMKVDAFLTAEFPLGTTERIVRHGDAAREIAQAAREGRFDLIIMPTHAGIFRRMLLGSTTAKVLNDADCPVMTSRHAEVIAPRPLEHREWLCAVGLSSDSERVLRFASAAANEAKSKLAIIHAIQSGETRLPVRMDLEEERVESSERGLAGQRIAELQQAAGLDVPVRIAVGSVKDALLEAAQQSDADAIIIGRNHHSSSSGRLRDLTYSIVRDSPFPVLSV